MDITNSKTNISISGIDPVKFLKEKYWLVLLIVIFIFSFALDLYVLTRYSLSYGIDGAFYDIQIRNILHYGFPMSNDPPLVYYLLTPFALIAGNSFLGIKIGMALMGSLLAFPAFFLTECYSKTKNGKIVGSKIPALLSAFMITVNVNYFALIGDFMQNLVGVLFLSIFIYFAIQWFENINDWKKYGVITILLLCINLLTHIYTGALAVTLFFSLLIFGIVLKWYKTRELPVFDLKILGLSGALVLVCFIVLFFVYPVMYTKYGTVLSFFNSSTTTTGSRSISSPVNGLIFCSLPYLLGVAASLIILYRGLKEKIPDVSLLSNVFLLKINKNTLLAGVYFSLAVVLAILVVVPTSDYQSRFLLIAFLPIGLLVPLGLKFMETEFIAKYPSRKLPATILVILVALIFAFSSFYTASESFNSMGPTITTDEYNDLVQLNASFVNTSDNNIVILASDMQTKYWIEYVLGDLGNGKNVTVVENINGVADNYKNSTIYVISSLSNQGSSGPGLSGVSDNSTLNSGNSLPNSGNVALNQGNSTSNSGNVASDSGIAASNQGNAGGNPANMGSNLGTMGMGGMYGSYDLSFLLPYGPPLLPNSWDMLSVNNGGSQNMQGPLNKDNQHPGNNTNNTNKSPGNMTSSTGGPPGNMTSNNNFPGNMQQQGNIQGITNQTQGAPGNNMGSASDGASLKVIESLTSSGTTIYTGKYFKVLKITL